MSDTDTTGRDLLAAIPFNGHLGLDILEVTDARGTVRLPDRDEVKNHVGTQHAGALFTTGEAAAGAAILGTFADMLDRMMPLARSAEIAYLKPARGPITATAKLVEAKADIVARFDANGKADTDVTVDLLDESGLKVVGMTVKWHLRRIS